MKLNQMTRNYLTINCPACGEGCRIQSTRSIQEKGKDAIVQCRNLECGYRGSVEISYGPVIEAKNPRPVPEDANQKLQAGVRNNFLRILCPHCAGVCRVRTSVQMISAQRQLYVFCQDDECGYRGVVFITHTDRLSFDTEGKLTAIPLAPEVREQCQQEMQLAHEKFSPSKKDAIK